VGTCAFTLFLSLYIYSTYIVTDENAFGYKVDVKLCLGSSYVSLSLMKKIKRKEQTTNMNG
jgi:hypothetical protein